MSKKNKIVRLDKFLEHVDSATKLAIESHISTCEVEQEDLVIKRISSAETSIKDFDIEKDISEGYASTRTLDFSGDIVIPEGIVLDIFNANPVIFYQHRSSSMPIGKALRANIDDYGLKVKIKYAVDENPQANTIYKLVKGKYIRQHSIGFVPLALIRRGQAGFDELNKRLMSIYPEYEGNAERIITKTLLLEVSVVNIADNQDSIIEEVKTWEDGDLELKQLGITVKEPETSCTIKYKDGDTELAIYEYKSEEGAEGAVIVEEAVPEAEPIVEAIVEAIPEQEQEPEPEAKIERIEAEVVKIERVVAIERVKSGQKHLDEMARKGIIVRVPKG